MADAMDDAFETEAGVTPDDDGNKSQTGRRVLAVVLIVLILLLAAVGYFLFNLMVPGGADTGATGDAMGWIRSIYGFGNEETQLTSPSGIALDPGNGNIWMADPSEGRLVEYQPDGTFASLIAPGREDTSTTLSGAIVLRLPADVAMDAGGLLYVAEPTYDVVRVFETDGTELGQIGVPAPLSLAVNDDYLVVGAEGGVAILDKEGNPIKLIGAPGRGPDQFDKVNGVAIDADNVVYAADTFNNRVSAWNIDGTKRWMVETGYPGNQQMTGETSFESTAAAQMQLPMGMTLDGAGRLVVADMHDFSLAVFNAADGAFVEKHGTLGFDDGKFFYPTDVDYDPLHDWFVVSDTGARRAQIVTLPGSGGSLLAQLRNNLSGPLTACLIPLLLIILVIALYYIVRWFRRRRDRNRAVAVAQGEGSENVD